MLVLWTCCLTIPAAVPPRAEAADERAIEQSIQRGVEWLKAHTAAGQTGPESLAAYALLRAGVPPESDAVARVLRGISGRVTSTGYRSNSSAIYEAVVDLMALEAADAVLYEREIQAIARHIMSRQNPNGAWDYTDKKGPATGDTSQTQYALLGLWAATRAGVDVPLRVWHAAARWHIGTQRADGGFVYHPFDGGETRHTMTAAGVGSLYLARRMVYPEAAGLEAKRPEPVSLQAQIPATDRRLRYLERLGAPRPDAAGTQTEQPTPATPVTDTRAARGDIDDAIRKGLEWLQRNYRIHAPGTYPLYYLYGLERMGALSGSPKIGDHDWYAEGADLLLTLQTGEGSWKETSGDVPATSFAVLFLSKATSKLVEWKPPPQRFGAGILSGGRGLPSDLSQVQVQAGEVKFRRPAGEIDDLLLALEGASDLQLPRVQEAIVDVVQLGDREQLIGQKDRLLKMADDRRPEIRRTALWALGHTGDLSLAPLLIRALNDASVDVNVDAYNALCALSRQPGGVGISPNPLEGLPDDAPQERRDEAVARWRKVATDRWQQWYLKVRPYHERDDLSETGTSTPR